MKDFQEFLVWEKSSKDTIDFKRVYADMAGDTLAGLVLSQIVYWHIPNKQGLSKLCIQKEGNWWIACTRAEWWESTRLTPRQIDRVLQILEDKHLIVKKVFKFAGSPTVHVRINHDVFVMSHNSYIANPLPNPYATEKKDIVSSDITDSLNGNVANGDMEIDESVKSLTETTAKTTTEKKDISPKVASTIKLSAEDYELLIQAIESVLQVKGSRALNYYHLMRGSSKKKEWQASTAYFAQAPVTGKELTAFGAWYAHVCPNANIPTSADKLEDYFIRFRSQKSQTQTLETIATQIFTENNLATDGVIQFNRRAK